MFYWARQRCAYSQFISQSQTHIFIYSQPDFKQLPWTVMIRKSFPINWRQGGDIWNKDKSCSRNDLESKDFWPELSWYFCFYAGQLDRLLACWSRINFTFTIQSLVSNTRLQFEKLKIFLSIPNIFKNRGNL